MKIPSLTRIPTHQKFNYEPRYYDPVKEDIAQRTNRIRKEMGPSGTSNYQSSFQQAFSRRASENKQSNITQLVLIMLLLATIFGYIYYGNIVFYLLMVFIPVYLVLRRKNFFRKQ